jgi:hypothetical protein
MEDQHDGVIDFTKFCKDLSLQTSLTISKANPNLSILFEFYVARSLFEIVHIFTKNEELISTRVTVRNLHSEPRCGCLRHRQAELSGANSRT